MTSRLAMCGCSSAAWPWAGPLLLLLLLCSRVGTVAARPQAQERTQGQEKQQAQQVQQRQQGTQGQQGQQFFPLLAFIGTRWFSQLSQQQQQRQQQQQQQQQQQTVTTTTTTTTTRVSSANTPMPAMTLPLATAPAPMPAILKATKPAVPAGDVLILSTPAAAVPAAVPAAAAAVAPAPVPEPAPAVAGVATPAVQQQQQQQQQQPPAAVNMVPAMPDHITTPQPNVASDDAEPETVDAQDDEEEWPEDESPTAQPAVAAAGAAPQAPPRGRSATFKPTGNHVPGTLSAARVQIPRFVSEAGPSRRRGEEIPVRPLSGFPRNIGQPPHRRHRHRVSPAAVPAILPLTEVLSKQQEQLQGQSIGA